MKKFLLFVMLVALAGCATLEERLAKRVGCDPTKVVVKNRTSVPAYSQYNFTCDGTAYVCRDAPFHSSCDVEASATSATTATPAPVKEEKPAGKTKKK